MLDKLRRRFRADRFAFFMTGAFGLAIITAIGANIAGFCLYEANQAVRIIELITGAGLMVFAGVGLRRLREEDKKEDK